MGSYLRHCDGDRKIERYELFSEQEQFKLLWLFILPACPKCHQLVMEWQGIKQNGQSTPKFRIKHKHHHEWLVRKEAYLMHGVGRPIGQASQEEAQDTAVVWYKTLQRYGVKAIPKRRKVHG